MAIIPPKRPPPWYPAYVAIFIPSGPGVDWDMATISAMLSVVIQEYLPQRSYKKGSVARPPPMANSPILKNS